MKIRAKLRVSSVTDDGTSDIVKFHAVHAGDKNSEDNTFAKATPAASLEMQINNPDLRGIIKPGQKFYVDFTPTDT